MSNVIVNGTTYNGIASVKLPLAAGNGFATFAEASYQEKTVTENGVVTPDAGYSALSKVTVNVPSGGTMSEASGTISALESDQIFIKVTGLSFTPKAFVLAWNETPTQNSTVGGLYVHGFSGIYRTGTNNTTVSGMSTQGVTMTLTEFTAEADTLEPSSGTGCHVLEHGFAVAASASGFPFRTGQSFSWYACG